MLARNHPVFSVFRGGRDAGSPGPIRGFGIRYNYFVRGFLEQSRADDRMKEIAIRFVIGGVSVSIFAVLGDICKPKTFAGLFGAAPSVALATLALTVAKNGPCYAAVETTSMIISVIGLFVYACCLSRIMIRCHYQTLGVALSLLMVWAATVFGIWFAVMK
jgi:hypothetical protein